jgi:hypothetical protein
MSDRVLTAMKGFSTTIRKWLNRPVNNQAERTRLKCAATTAANAIRNDGEFLSEQKLSVLMAWAMAENRRDYPPALLEKMFRDILPRFLRETIAVFEQGKKGCEVSFAVFEGVPAFVKEFHRPALKKEIKALKAALQKAAEDKVEKLEKLDTDTKRLSELMAILCCPVIHVQFNVALEKLLRLDYSDNRMFNDAVCHALGIPNRSFSEKCPPRESADVQYEGTESQDERLNKRLKTAEEEGRVIDLAT